MNFVEFWSIFGRFLALFGPFDVKTEPCASALVHEPRSGERRTLTSLNCFPSLQKAAGRTAGASLDLSDDYWYDYMGGRRVEAICSASSACHECGRHDCGHHARAAARRRYSKRQRF